MTDPKKPARIKIEANLYKRGEVYYYRLGDFEQSLGALPSDKRAIEHKRVLEMKRDSIGAIAFKFKAKDLWPEYLEQRRAERDGLIEGRAQIGTRTYDEMILIWSKHLSKFFANKRLADINDILWNEYCRQSELADLTNHRKVLKHFLKWCVESGYARLLPIMRVPKIVRRKRKLLTPEQVMEVIKHSHGTLLLFVSLYLYMGVRRGEQMQIRWEYANLAERWILIPDDTTRTRRGRVIPLNGRVAELLEARRREHLAKGLDSPWVFPKAGNPAEHATENAPSKSWNTMLVNAKLRDAGLQPHDLRATYERFANKRPDFTATQVEKMAGASIAVQRKIYLHGFQADDLRGLEEVVQIAGLDALMDSKLVKLEDGENTGLALPINIVDKGEME